MLSPAPTPTPSPTVPDAPDSRMARMKQALIVVAVMLVVGVLFFFIGLIQGKKPIPDLESRTAAAEAQLGVVQDRAALNEALALTYRTTIDLDTRNFGLANDRLHAAAAALNGLHMADGTAVDDLRRAMAETDLTVGTDLAVQRAQVLTFAQEIEALRQDVPPGDEEAVAIE